MKKPNINNYVSAGIYCLSNKLLKLLNIKEYIDMLELLTDKKKGSLWFFLYMNWTDIGRPKDLIKEEKINIL